MYTCSFIGSDKNAGKTTALNFVYRNLQKKLQEKDVCISSIGINGENIDSLQKIPKPKITLKPDSLFVTAPEHLHRHTGKYRILELLGRPDFNKDYLLVRSRAALDIVLQGPNNKAEILALKHRLLPYLSKGILLLDGSVERQFLAHPEISDSFCLALFLSKDKEQQIRAQALVLGMKLPVCSTARQELLKRNSDPTVRSLVFDQKGNLIYLGRKIPFTDRAMQDACIGLNKEPGLLYLNGALSPSLFKFLRPLRNLEIILDNFTLLKNDPGQTLDSSFRPKLYLRHPVKVKRIFLKQEAGADYIYLPSNIPVCNLFRSLPGNIDLDT